MGISLMIYTILKVNECLCFEFLLQLEKSIKSYILNLNLTSNSETKTNNHSCILYEINKNSDTLQKIERINMSSRYELTKYIFLIGTEEVY